MTDATWSRDTMTTTSPGWLSPPVRSDTRSQRDQPVPFHDSQTVGGSSGSTPTPRTAQSRRMPIASPGAGSSRPEQELVADLRRARERVERVGAQSRVPHERRLSPDRLPMWASFRGGIGSSAVVWNTMDSVCSVRGVPTSVCSGTMTTSSRGAASQKTRSACAAVGGNSVVPMRSRKAMYSLSGTRFSR